MTKTYKVSFAECNADGKKVCSKHCHSYSLASAKLQRCLLSQCLFLSYLHSHLFIFFSLVFSSVGLLSCVRHFEGEGEIKVYQILTAGS